MIQKARQFYIIIRLESINGINTSGWCIRWYSKRNCIYCADSDIICVFLHVISLIISPLEEDLLIPQSVATAELISPVAAAPTAAMTPTSTIPKSSSVDFSKFDWSKYNYAPEARKRVEKKAGYYCHCQTVNHSVWPRLFPVMPHPLHSV